MTNKKVLILVTRPVWGGAQHYVFDLARHLQAHSFRVCVGFGPDKSPVLWEKLDRLGIRAVVFRLLARQINPWRDLFCIFSLRRFMRVEKFYVVHLNSSKAGVLGAIAAKLAGVPRVVFTAHGFAFNERVGFFRKFFYILAERIASWFRDKVITVSQYDRAAALRHKISRADKLVAIHNGILPNEAGFLSREEAGKKIFGHTVPKGPVIGCIADFTRNKGLEFFVAAAAEVLKSHPGAMFVVIGEGEGRVLIEDQIKRLNLSSSFALTGFISDAEIYQKAFDAYVCSSLKEGLPYAVLYSLAAGVPTVATRVGGIPEIITNAESGLLVPPADSRALATAILELLENPELAANLAAAGKEKIKKDFSMEEMLNKTLKVYAQ